MTDSETVARIGRGTGRSEQVRLVVDGHVHVHPAHDEVALVEGASQRLRQLSPGIPTLFLTECAGASVFEKWRDGLSRMDVRQTGETDSIVVNDRLLVLAGRQVVTCEKIEVLAVATNCRIQDGMTLEMTLDEIDAVGAVAVLPWGLGKWLGTRGELVEKVVAGRRILLGDNAGRPFFWPEPGIFKKHAVLPGTDPLRAANEEQLVGGYGFCLDCEIGLDRPAESIRQTLLELKAGCPQRIGSRISFPYSLTRQFAHLIPRAGSKGSLHGQKKEPSPLAAQGSSDTPHA